MPQQSKNPRKWAHIGTSCLLQLMFYSEALQHLPKRLSLQQVWEWRFPMLVRLSTLTVSSFLSPSKWSSISKLFCSAYFLPEEKQKIITNNRHKMNLKKRSIVVARGSVRKLLASRFFHLPTFFLWQSLLRWFLEINPELFLEISILLDEI